MHGDEFCPVRKRRLDLDVVDHFRDAVHALRAGDDLRACAGRLCGEVGASTWNGLTAARFCAPDGEALHNDLTTALTLALSGAPPRLWVN